MRKFTEGLLDIDLIINALEIKPGQTIIDAGCGNGYMTKIFSQTVSTTGRGRWTPKTGQCAKL
ncbi:hypothetical protein [uncultured Desulfosarcina sp.]|uniref:hypothetical protein n=1 Tax=uncultured Desulfosarcina sp. TaxID=218289 RepID=UPI00374A1ADF